MFKTEKAALSDAMSVIKTVVKAKAKIPIQSNVLIEREGDRLLARGNNITLEISVPFAATIADAFASFTVDAHRFADIVGAAPEDSISVEGIHQGAALTNIQIKSGRSRLRLPVLPASDFPKLDAGSLTHRLSLSAEILRRELDAASYAVETDPTRFYLCGVYFEPCKEGLALVATDGLRLVRRMIPPATFDQDDISGIAPVIVPSEAVDRISKLLANCEDVAIELSRDMIRVEAAGKILISKLVDGSFPHYRQIMPVADSLTSHFSGQAMSAALGRMLAVTADAGNGVLFTFRKDAIALAARDTVAGEGEDEVSAETDGEVSIGFHGRHFRDAVAHIDNDKLELRFAGGERANPALIRGAGDELNYTILMPVRVKGMNYA